MTVGFADQKGTLYMTKKDTLKVGSTVMLMNSIIKKDLKAIVITNKSKILKTSPLTDVPKEKVEEDHALACPPPAKTVEIKAVHTSPVKTLLTIRGQIISVSKWGKKSYYLFISPSFTKLILTIKILVSGRNVKNGQSWWYRHLCACLKGQRRISSLQSDLVEGLSQKKNLGWQSHPTN